LITKTDTLDFFDTVYNDETQEWEDVWTGYWYLSKINASDETIVLWNNLDERQVTINTEDIETIIFKKADRGVGRKLLLGVCLGGIAWAAIAENSTQSITALGISLASAAYLASTVGRTKYREYRYISIED
jgi:hypothetical protein